MINFHFKFRNKDLQKIFDNLSSLYLEDIPNKYIVLYKNFIIRLKKHSRDENTIILATLHGLISLWKVDINDSLISDYFREKLRVLEKSYRYEMDRDKEAFLKNIFEMDYDIFLVKMVIKLTILSYWKEYLDLIENKKNYYKSAWLLIPYLTLRESKFLGFFQDAYFKNLFPRKYKKTKNFYFKKIKKLEIPWEHLISILNNLTETMSEANVIWKTKIRRKTYFSIYNKMQRKKEEDIFDLLWVRVIFNSIQELKKFQEIFERKYIFIKKKDYILNPKKNWYQSLHYRFISLFRDLEIMVELQLRTDRMDRDIHWNNQISHYNYTLSKNKWSDEFKEVNFGLKYLNKYIKKHNIKKIISD